MIAVWSYGLVRNTGAILLDMNPGPGHGRAHAYGDRSRWRPPYRHVTSAAARPGDLGAAQLSVGYSQPARTRSLSTAARALLPRRRIHRRGAAQLFLRIGGIAYVKNIARKRRFGQPWRPCSNFAAKSQALASWAQVHCARARRPRTIRANGAGRRGSLAAAKPALVGHWRARIGGGVEWCWDVADRSATILPFASTRPAGRGEPTLKDTSRSS